ncbi:MAG: hypothetical protein KDC06_12375, partial [Chitinophagaceae bacterium]|nr:hypothetical protein [Chitinophagaceae bacterium]
NGADYQYVITYLSTQEDKIGGQLGKNLREAWTPFLKDKMSKQGFEMCPYVNVHNESPKQGYATFYDQPRYSTGYLALLQIPGYITETHMLKPYEQRVNATLAFLESGLELLDNVRIRNQKIADRKELKTQKTFAIDWQIDSTSVSQILFKGYESGYKPSEVTGEKRLFYNR